MKLITNQKLIDNYAAIQSNSDEIETNNTQTPFTITEQTDDLAPADAIDQLSIWDCDSALKRVGNKKERLHALVDMFLKGMPNRIDRLQIAAEENDFRTVESLAHEIKGVTSNIDGIQMASASSLLESAARNKNSIEVGDLLPSLHESYRVLSENLLVFNADFQSNSMH